AYGRRGVATRHYREQVPRVARWSQSTPTILGYTQDDGVYPIIAGAFRDEWYAWVPQFGGTNWTAR
ncbi:MAG: hypothetical protein K6V36_06945, partial [Anaerolineae bacterium]|nr:hypothetical protein [Anaerolineae bacterium]